MSAVSSAYPAAYPLPTIPCPGSQAAADSTAIGGSQPKVLHVINGEHFSGAERVQQLLGRRMAEFGYDTQFACVKPGRFPELCGLEAERVIQAAMRNRFDLAIVAELAQHIRQQQIALLHAHTPRTALVTAVLASKTGLPWVYHVHSPTTRDSTRGLINQVNGMLERLALNRCDLLITVSRSLRQEMLRRGVPRSRLVVVPNGVPDIQPIDPNTRLESHSWRMGLIALMRPRKGVEVALAAMHQLRKQNKPVQLELIGGFETELYQRQTLERIHSLQLQDCVHWTGFTDNIPQALRRLDGLLLPSLFGEGMPMVVLEALAAAVPVVATRVEGTPEVIRDGCEGYLAEPGDAHDLAEKIGCLISDRSRWSELSGNALARHRSSFSDQRMAARIARAYRRVLQR